MIVGKGRVLEVVDGVEIREKVSSKRLGKLVEGQLVRGTGERDVWRVENVSEAGARVKGISGRVRGQATTWSSSSAGHKFLTEAELEAEKTAVAEERASADADPDAPPAPSAAAPSAAAPEPRKRRGALPDETPETIAKVVALREAGKTFKEIAAELGWSEADRGADRAYKAFHDSKKAPTEKKAAPGIRPTVRRKAR